LCGFSREKRISDRAVSGDFQLAEERTGLFGNFPDNL
jgi:hypothetical protein